MTLELSRRIMRTFDDLRVKGFDAITGLTLAHDAASLEMQLACARNQIDELNLKLERMKANG